MDQKKLPAVKERKEEGLVILEHLHNRFLTLHPRLYRYPEESDENTYKRR